MTVNTQVTKIKDFFSVDKIIKYQTDENFPIEHLLDKANENNV